MSTAVEIGSWGPLSEPIHTDLEIDPDGAAWRENAYFTFWDRDRRIYGQAHFTTSANAGARVGRCEIMFEDRLLEVIEPLEPMSFESDSISVDLNGIVKVRAGEFELDFETRPRFAEVADYGASDTVPSLVDERPLKHFQRSGNFDAELRVDGETIAFSGVNFRDRTWGYREDSSWQEYYGFMCCFDDFDLTFLKFMTTPEDQRARGFLMGGRSGEIVETLVTERDNIGTIRSVDLTLDDGKVLTADFGASECPAVFVPAGIPRDGRAVTIYDMFQPLRFTDGEGGEGFALVEQSVLRQLV